MGYYCSQLKSFSVIRGNKREGEVGRMVLKVPLTVGKKARKNRVHNILSFVV